VSKPSRARKRHNRMWKACEFESLTTDRVVRLSAKFGGSLPRELTPARRPADVAMLLRDPLTIEFVEVGDFVRTTWDEADVTFVVKEVHRNYGVALVRRAGEAA